MRAGTVCCWTILGSALLAAAAGRHATTAWRATCTALALMASGRCTPFGIFLSCAAGLALLLVLIFTGSYLSMSAACRRTSPLSAGKACSNIISAGNLPFCVPDLENQVSAGDRPVCAVRSNLQTAFLWCMHGNDGVQCAVGKRVSG